MSKIEEVKKILHGHMDEYWHPIPAIAKQICQLFEPKISPYALPSQAYGEYFTPPEPQPDEGRFLTDEEIMEEVVKMKGLYHTGGVGFQDMLLNFGKVINAKAASIKDAECQQRMKRIFQVGDTILETAWHGDYSDGNDAFGIDEGRVKARELLDSLEEKWQSLKKQEETAL